MKTRIFEAKKRNRYTPLWYPPDSPIAEISEYKERRVLVVTSGSIDVVFYDNSGNVIATVNDAFEFSDVGIKDDRDFQKYPSHRVKWNDDMEFELEFKKDDWDEWLRAAENSDIGYDDVMSYNYDEIMIFAKQLIKNDKFWRQYEVKPESAASVFHRRFLELK